MKISIVTPSYNQAAHLEQTIQSVLFSAEGCGADLEYVVIDGGSSDGSREIIQKYADRLAYWCSEPDGGQYEAINKGFEKTTGEIMAWLNSSDLYLPWTLSTVREIFEKFSEVDWITSLPKTCIRENGVFESLSEGYGFSASRLLRGKHGGPSNGEFIQQESCFWRRSLWGKVGANLNCSNRFAADFALWGDFFRHSRCTGVDMPLAAFRFHGRQRSAEKNYLTDIENILRLLKKEQRSNFVTGYQNIMRYWQPDSKGAGGVNAWKLDKHNNDLYLDIVRWWGRRARDIQWWGSKITALPLRTL